MQYELTEEQRMLQDMVRRLAKERVEPGATRRDAEGEFDWAMVDLMRENGLYGIDFPEAYGGSGAGNLGGVEAVAGPWHGREHSAEVVLPPLATIWLRWDG